MLPSRRSVGGLQAVAIQYSLLNEWMERPAACSYDLGIKATIHQCVISGFSGVQSEAVSVSPPMLMSPCSQPHCQGDRGRRHSSPCGGEH